MDSPIKDDDINSLNDEHFDYYQEVARSGFADMLHDTERNQKYYQALKKAVDKMHDRGLRAIVLDIGTGTGILSMMAVRCGADSVTACEAFLPMAECAEKIIEHNGLATDIRIIKKRSTEIQIGNGRNELRERANILVTEVFDTELIGEGAIQTFNHAHEHLLEANSIVVPSSATIYAQAVESSLAWAWNTPKLLANLDGEVMIRTPSEIIKCKGSSELHDIQLNQIRPSQFSTIVAPTPVFTFDWSSKEKLPKRRNSKVPVITVNGGIAQAIFMWWDLKMDEDGEILLSCAPHWAHPDYERLKEENTENIPTQNVIPWRDHWMQAVYYLPEQTHVYGGDNLTLLAHHDEFSLWFDVKRNLDDDGNDVSLERPMCQCGFHMAYSRTRIGQLNDNHRNKKYLKYLENEITSESVVLFLSDGSLIGLAIAALKAKHVYCLEPNKYSSQVVQKYIDFNRIRNVEIIQTLDADIIRNWEEITHVIGEPSFITSILPWENFSFLNLIDQCRSRLKENVKIIPCEASIHAVPVEFLDLQKISAPFENCEGFDLSIFDTLLKKSYELADSTVEAQPLWEYPNRAVGLPKKIFKINFQTGLYEGVPANLALETVCSCNGIGIWVDWNFNSIPGKYNRISTGPSLDIQLNAFVNWDMNTRQGVCLLSKPISKNHDGEQIHIICNSEYDNKAIKFAFKIKHEP